MTKNLPHRVLIIAALFPPDVIGGAEMSAWNLTQWLRGQGVEVGVLTTAKSRDEVLDGAEVDGLKLWRVWMPRPYPKFYYAKAAGWKKPIWHLQDHFDPRNRSIMARVLDAFQPDSINIHVLQGLGYNALAEIGKRNIPTVFFLHDLALACFRMSMFRNGQDCTMQCGACRVSSLYKLSQVKKVPRIGFCSPSQANLDRLAQYFPVKQWAATAILNANRYPKPTVERQTSDKLRIIYVGRLQPNKGIGLLMDVVDRLATKFPLCLTVVGSGPDETVLRERFEAKDWCRFTGFVTQAEISNLMVNSDLLCIPSIWAENSPGVVIHALGLGLPVMGSNKGGIPELVEDAKNGVLVAAGDEAAWEAALRRVCEQPEILQAWRDYALQHAERFAPDCLGNKILTFMERMRLATPEGVP